MNSPVVLASSEALVTSGARDAGPGAVAALGAGAAVAAAAALGEGTGQQGWRCTHAGMHGLAQGLLSFIVAVLGHLN